QPRPPSPYSSVVHGPTIVVPSHTSECEWRRPRLCPSSWPAVANDMLAGPLIQAREGLPPTVAVPEKPQAAFEGKAYTRWTYVETSTPAAAAAASAYVAIAPESHVVPSRRIVYQPTTSPASHV